MNFKEFKFFSIVLLVLFFSFPISFEKGGPSSFVLSQAQALSASTKPLGSNIFVEIAKKLNPAVVNISIKGKSAKHLNIPRNPRGPKGQGKDPFKDFYDRFFGDRENNNRPKRGMGSGLIIDAEGHILTNYHVVDGADEIKVKVQDGEQEVELNATLVGSDSKTDIALIKLKPEAGEKSSYNFLNLGDSDKLEVGEWVMAIGNPFGLSHTVTVGVVSAKDRSIGAGPYDEYIQTDASINPGNSGGPLININGDVVGINTAIISGNSGGNVGIGFAIPINVAKAILKDLKEKGSVTRGWLGVMIQKITPDLADSFGLNQSEGALVGDVIANGPASKAGIKRGDVITKFDNRVVKTMEDLPKIVASTTPGRSVPVEIIREGQTQIINVTIDVLKDDVVTKQAAVDTLGMQVQEITPELAKSLKLDTEEGVLVSDVTPGKSAGEAGMRRGDVITEMNRSPIKNLADYDRIMGGLKPSDTALLLVRRGGSTIYIAVKIQ